MYSFMVLCVLLVSMCNKTKKSTSSNFAAIGYDFLGQQSGKKGIYLNAYFCFKRLDVNLMTHSLAC